MSQTYNLSGRSGLFSNLLRAIVASIAVIGGIFMLAASAAFAFFVVIGIAILAFIAFAFFWTKAKILGKPFGPKAQFEAARRDMEAQFDQMQPPSDNADGPIIDAHRTPEGWSVDD